MTSTARRAVTVAASLAAVGALAACGSSDGAAAEGTTQAAETPAAESGESSEPAESSAPAESSEVAEPAEGGIYTDGVYTATGSYISPGGEESIEVALTLAGDVVSEVEVTSLAKHPNSERFQGEFISGIEGVVVGVPIDELAVDKVAGSSLTSGGFNEAVELIKAQARA